VFYSIRTVGNGITQHLVADHICPGISNAMNLTISSTTGRRHGIAKKTTS